MRINAVIVMFLSMFMIFGVVVFATHNPSVFHSVNQMTNGTFLDNYSVNGTFNFTNTLWGSTINIINLLNITTGTLDARMATLIGFNNAILLSYPNLTGSISLLERGNFTSGLNAQLVLANETKNLTETINFTAAFVRGLNISYELKYLNDTKANSPITLGYSNLTGTASIGYINLTGTSFIGYVNLTGSIAPLERQNFTSGFNTQLFLANETKNLTELINFITIRVASRNVSYEIDYLNLTKANSPVILGYSNLTGTASIGYVNLTGSISPLERSNFTTALDSVMLLGNQSVNLSVLGTFNETYNNLLVIENRVSQGSNGTAGSGTGMLFRSTDAKNQTESIGQIIANFTTTTNQSEASNLLFFTRTGGGTLTQRLQIDEYGNANLTDRATLFNITAGFIFVNLSLSTFPASSCSGSNKATSSGINGQLTCSSDLTDASVTGLERMNFTSGLNTVLVLANETWNFTQVINFTTILVRGRNASYEIDYLNSTKANSPVILGYGNLTGSIASLERQNFTNGLNTQLMLANETKNMTELINFTTILVRALNVSYELNYLNTTKAISPVSVSRNNITDATNFALFNQTNNYTQQQIFSAKVNITNNITFTIPASNGEICPVIFRGITANYSQCFNSTGQSTEKYGVFVLPI